MMAWLRFIDKCLIKYLMNENEIRGLISCDFSSMKFIMVII
jgi:hypothetical protein